MVILVCANHEQWIFCPLIIVAKKFVLNVKLKNYVLNFIDCLEFSLVVVNMIAWITNILKKTDGEISLARAKYRINNKFKFTCNNCDYNTYDKRKYCRHCLSQKHIDKLVKLKTSEILEVGQ